jgi:DNA polymerase III subunit epsilon
MAAILWIDIEGTDVEAKRGGGIHQIAYVLEVDGNVVKSSSHNCKPFKNDLVNAQSLAVCDVSYEQIMAYPDATEAFKDIINTIHPYKPVILGGFNNCIYDNPMFQSWWFKCCNALNMKLELVKYIYFDALDVRVLAIDHLKDVRGKMDGFKLSQVAGYLGIDVNSDGLHEADYDLYLTMEIYKKIKQ